MNFENFRRQNPLIRKSYPNETVEALTRFSYNAGKRDGFNMIFLPGLFVFTLLGIFVYFSL